MCLIFLSLNHPNYKLIIAANRDEFYNRRTAAADYWSDHPEILGGRDLEAFGTWMAMTKSGRISLITNYRDLSHLDPNAPSRGQLVSNYLLDKRGPEEYLESIAPHSKRYNGFNLITGNQNELWYFSNYQNKVQKIQNGVHGLSNHLLDTPWPKVRRVNEKMMEVLKHETPDPEILLNTLYDEVIAADKDLPDTGVGLERERALSSIFIKTPNYGTRCSTVLLVDHSDQVLYSERTYDLTLFTFSSRVYKFKISGF